MMVASESQRNSIIEIEEDSENHRDSKALSNANIEIAETETEPVNSTEEEKETPSIDNPQEINPTGTLSSKSIELALAQHEKDFLEQEAQRKEKIKEGLLDRQKASKSYYTISQKELIIAQYM
jgi:hypothetical protein